MKVHKSARKHGIADEDSFYVASHASVVFEIDIDQPRRELRLGFDTSGRLLEVVVLVSETNDEIIIHAMKMRRGFAPLFARS